MAAACRTGEPPASWRERSAARATPVFEAWLRRKGTMDAVVRSQALLMRGAIIVNERSVAVRTHHVDVGAGGRIIAVSGAHSGIDRNFSAMIPEVVTDAVALGKGCAFAWPKHDFSSILDQRQLSSEDVDEFILVVMPAR